MLFLDKRLENTAKLLTPKCRILWSTYGISKISYVQTS